MTNQDTTSAVLGASVSAISIEMAMQTATLSILGAVCGAIGSFLITKLLERYFGDKI
jgi:hypothetical protein